MGIVLRPFTPEDQSGARDLILEGLGDHFGYIDESLNPDIDNIGDHYLSAGHLFIVAELDGVLVGTGALVEEAPEIGRIVRMSVKKGYRRQGIGRELAGCLLRLARQRGFGRVLVETNLDWDDAIRLYENLGFSEYDRDSESIHMRLVLENTPFQRGRLA